MPYVTSWERIAEKRGAEKNMIKTARMMLADGLTIDVISKYTGLSTEEIEKLKVQRDN